MAWAIAAQWLQVFSGGAWAAPWLGKLGPAWQWGPRTQVEEGETRGCSTLGPLHNELKSKVDPFGGTGLAGPMPLQVGVGRGVLLGWVPSQGEGRRRAPASCPDLGLARIWRGPLGAGLP